MSNLCRWIFECLRCVFSDPRSKPSLTAQLSAELRLALLSDISRQCYGWYLKQMEKFLLCRVFDQFFAVISCSYALVEEKSHLCKTSCTYWITADKHLLICWKKLVFWHLEINHWLTLSCFQCKLVLFGFFCKRKMPTDA